MAPSGFPDCGCRVLNSGHRIEFCYLHGSAPRYLALLQQAGDVLAMFAGRDGSIIPLINEIEKELEKRDPRGNYGSETIGTNAT